MAAPAAYAGLPKAKRATPRGGQGGFRMRTTFEILGDWEKAMRGTKLLGLDAAINRAVHQEAAMAERLIKQNLTEGGAGLGQPFKKLSPWSLAARRLGGTRAVPRPPFKGTKPLIRGGDMRNSVTNVILYDGKRETVAFVGVLKQAIGGKPGSPRMVNIAQVHEFGKTIVVRLTPKMRRWLAVLAKEVRGGARPKATKGSTTAKQFLVIHVPARPFIRPAFEAWSKGAAERMQKRILILTKGKLGTA